MCGWKCGVCGVIVRNNLPFLLLVDNLWLSKKPPKFGSRMWEKN